MGSARTLLLGAAAGFVAAVLLAVGAGVVVVNLLIPWDDICATVGPLQTVAREGKDVIAALSEWLARAETWLDSAVNAPSNLGGSLGGILDRAGELAGDAASAGLDLLTAPLQTLIDLAKVALAAVERAVEVAESALASIDRSRCG